MERDEKSLLLKIVSLVKMQSEETYNLDPKLGRAALYSNTLYDPISRVIDLDSSLVV